MLPNLVYPHTVFSNAGSMPTDNSGDGNRINLILGLSDYLSNTAE
jgi:hypothetical protein